MRSLTDGLRLARTNLSYVLSFSTDELEPLPSRLGAFFSERMRSYAVSVDMAWTRTLHSYHYARSGDIIGYVTADCSEQRAYMARGPLVETLCSTAKMLRTDMMGRKTVIMLYRRH